MTPEELKQLDDLMGKFYDMIFAEGTDPVNPKLLQMELNKINSVRYFVQFVRSCKSTD